ncbi:MAG: hypothetical protein ACRC2R_13075 [Xenococcaceae cyanobacterium]
MYLTSKHFDRQNDELNRFTKTLYNFLAWRSSNNSIIAVGAIGASSVLKRKKEQLAE